MPLRDAPSMETSSNTCVCSATTRPVRACTCAATRVWRSTESCTGIVTRDRRGITSACRPAGSCVPASVTNETSTMASSPNGLNNNRSCWLPSTVVPDAKYQSGGRSARARLHPDVAAVFEDVRHRGGTTDRLHHHAGLGRAPARRPPARFTSSPGASRIVSEAGAASPPGITVMVASMSVWARLAITTVSVAAPSGVDVPPAQYHALEATSAAGTPMLAPHGTRRRRRARAGRVVLLRDDGRDQRDHHHEEDRAAPNPPAAGRRRLGGGAWGSASSLRNLGSGLVGSRHVGSRLVGAHTRSHQNASSSSSASGSGFTDRSRRWRDATARADGSRRTRVRRHRQSTSSQMTSAPPSIAQRTHCTSYTIDTDTRRRTTNPFAHPNDFWWRSRVAVARGLPLRVVGLTPERGAHGHRARRQWHHAA